MAEMTDNLSREALPHPRSSFVTVLAWIFIIIGAFTIFVGLMQNVMVQMVFSREEIAMSFGPVGEGMHLPGYLAFMLLHFDLVLLGFLLLAVILLITSIALLKRRNWARITFILLMFTAVIWNVAGILLQVILYRGFVDMAGGQVMAPDLQNMMMVMQIFMLLFTVAMTAACIYIIVKLCSKRVRREFVVGRSISTNI